MPSDRRGGRNIRGQVSSRGEKSGRGWGRSAWWMGRGRWRSQWQNRRPKYPVGLSDSFSGDDTEAAPFTTVKPCRIPAWSLYFPNEPFKESSTLLKKANALKDYLARGNPDWVPDGKTDSFPIQFPELKQVALGDNWPEPEVDFEVSPEVHLGCLGLGIHLLAEQKLGNEKRIVDHFRPRLINHSPVRPLKQLKSNLTGKLVTFQGTVVRIHASDLTATRMAFRCSACHAEMAVPVVDQKLAPPARCVSEGCKSRSFRVAHDSKLVQMEDSQFIQLQEMLTEEERDCGRTPNNLEIELTNDLVNTCVPGDIISVTGVLKAAAVDEDDESGGTAEGNRKKKQGCVFSYQIRAVGVKNFREEGADKLSAVPLTETDLAGIDVIRYEKEVFRLLVSSLCPVIFGNELVKAGLVLSLFGGVTKNVSAGSTVRGDIHTLIVGDPGLGKSQMLKATANISPRGVLVCGNTSTSAGLTLGMSNEGILEAGALVLADQGMCCIDEFDKMSSQHHLALLEAMEQQNISLAKAGVQCSIPARTTIAAAANPLGGHYDKSKTVSENLRLNPALLSRFDLIFILFDRGDEEQDAMLSKHVMEIQGRAGNSRINDSLFSNASTSSSSFLQRGTCAYRSAGENSSSLIERLRFEKGEEFDPVPHQLLRKYVTYGLRFTKPTLSYEACDVIQRFYMDLRKQRHIHDSTPITTRQLESLIRMTEARAKAELRSEATAQDAEDVVEIMKYCMSHVFTDDFRLIDFNRLQSSAGMPKKSGTKKFMAALQRICEVEGRNRFTVSEMKDLAGSLQIDQTNFVDFLDVLNIQGYLLKKGNRLYELQSVDA
ncbi:unnamed protein product [Cyprideis torosa]|uniref:DNA helicase n=1 Tax=Cyprideis torosa TaxID=163714 RepID=A0A7R8WJI3_9CRUS|nr:unnamed protein product [Cyprideis torosa]CAG0902015.1 unnamed protein product [Cyprideis torosa]